MANKPTTKETVTSEVKKKEVVQKVEKKTKPKFKATNDMKIVVRSNVYGTLIFTNYKSGDVVRWAGYGETQDLTPDDIRSMKSQQIRFMTENWITIAGVVSDTGEDLDDVDIQEVYEYFGIKQYFKNSYCPEELSQIFTWSVQDIKNKIPLMSKSVQDAIIVMSNSLIRKGEVDSISKVRAIEEVLNCNLTALNDE